MEKQNISESVYNRLKNLAKERKRPVQEIFKYYAMERFLYRLSISPYKDSFFLKGGLMLMVWNPVSHRATVDIDLLGKTAHTIENLQNIIQAICAIEVAPPDGIQFITDKLTLARTQVDADYKGISIAFSAQLFSANLPIRIDLGFSDTILPRPARVKYPVLLNFPAPDLKGYTPETSIAEKLQSIVRLGLINTRMKDFYDVWLLIHQFQFDRKELNSIILKVFQNRETVVNTIPAAFSEAFYNDPIKIVKWKTFLKDIAHEEIALETVVCELKEFFKEVLRPKYTQTT